MSRYVKDPNNSKKQVAGTLPANAYDRARSPESCSLVKTPNFIQIADAPTNDVGFYFGGSASFAKSATTEGGSVLTGSSNYVNFGSPPAGTQLNIHPTAWSGSSADAGKIIFVYKSGLSTGGF